MLCMRKLRRSFNKTSLSRVKSSSLSNRYSVSGIVTLTPRICSNQSPQSCYKYENFNVVVGFCSITPTVLVQARDPAKLSCELQDAMDTHRLKDAWSLYDKHMQTFGFPRKSVVTKLLVCSVETLDVQWLGKAFSVFEHACAEGKQTLFDKEPLIYLCLGLAKCGMPVPSSTVLRKLIDMELYPPVAAWSAALAYMVVAGTGPGAHLAAELVLEIGYLFQDNRVDPRKKSNAPLLAMKPNTAVFNIALAGLLFFDSSRKAEQLLDMMPRLGVKADTNLLIIMTQIYEKNGRREELKNLQRHIDEAPNLTDSQFHQYYNCLLSCHLKLGDLNSASSMVLDMLRKAKEANNSLAAATFLSDVIVGDDQRFHLGTAKGKSLKHDRLENLQKVAEYERSIVSYEEFSKDRSFSTLASESQLVLARLLAQLRVQVELITTEHGILQPTEKIYVKLLKAFLEDGKIKDLANFLIKMEKVDCPVSNDDSALVHVINSCISLGWLDQAHDLLDEMRLAGLKTGSSIYASLLKAYCKTNRPKEVASLLRDARKAGIQLDASCYEVLMQSRILENDTHGALSLFKAMKEAKTPRLGNQQFDMLVKGCEGSGEAGLMSKLLQEVKEGQRIDYGVHDWNNVIHFFCKKRLMQDAEKALKKMKSLGHTPNVQTFHSMVTGYAAIGGKYIEVTELWGEMKDLSLSTPIKFDQELLDSVLYTFVRGGYFVRANEVVEIMEKGNMFIDKYKYRTLFLKYHKTLYKGKSPKFQTEAQLKKREAVLAFKKWVGLC